MSVSDLIFILIFLATVTTLIVILVHLLRGRRGIALRISRVLGIGIAIYLIIAALVALLSPQKILTMGEDRCFDEMCFAATSVKVAPIIGQGRHQAKADGDFYLVNIRISSHSHGRAQSEALVRASLVDSKGHTFEVSPQGQRVYDTVSYSNPPLTSRLQPGESISSVQVFDVPVAASDLALHIGHPGGPNLFIIGDDESPLHKPTIIRLKP